MVVVDDAEDLRRLIVFAIRRDGRMQVLADVGDGRQGIEAVHRHHPSVVLMDVSMPVMDGLSATRELKTAFPELPIAMLTGLGDARVAEAAAEAGADAFLEKTTALDEIIDVLVELAAQ